MPETTRSLSRIFALIAVWTAVVVVAACAEMPLRPATDAAATAEAGYGRAFGRTVLVQDGKEKKWGFGEELTLFVRSVRTGQMQRMAIKGDGGFLWPLEAGEYVIVAYGAIGPPRSGRLWASFVIAQPGQAVYIGDLRIEETRTGYRFAVLDKYAEALAKVEPRLSEGRFSPAKSLMAFEEKLGTYSNVWAICAERGGLKCDRKIQGVEPLQPPGATSSYPSVTSLTPLLEWLPSSKEGITYDVAVYESLVLTVDMPGALRARGAPVAYAEGLREPRFQLSAPLQPNRKYDWSVRLRDGDSVSTWSVSSYFVFYVVGWAAGSGQWFGLSTPDK